MSLDSNWQHENAVPPDAGGDPWPMDGNDQLVRELWVASVQGYGIDGANTWANQQNVVGPKDSALAVNNAGGLGGRGGLLMSFGNILPVAHQGLVIVEAGIYFYAQQRGTLLNNGDFKAGVNIAGQRYEKHVKTDNFNTLGSPVFYNLTADVAGDFDRLSSLQAWVEHDARLETHVGECDAVRLRLVFAK